VKLLSAEFVTSAAAGGRVDDIPRDGLAHVAFAGRSNVGKSSLLNALCRRSIARTSAAPGKTRLANVYRVTSEGGPGGPGRWSCYFVDLPGYGYARGGSDAAQELRRVADAYFAERLRPERGARGKPGEAGPPSESERGWGPASGEKSGYDGRVNRVSVLLLVDSRHPGLDSDVQAARWFDSIGVGRHVVATKVDKLSRAERAKNLRELERIFGTAALPVSATGGEGLDELWTLIARLARAERPR
jgi:GTP-binding protein